MLGFGFGVGSSLCWGVSDFLGGLTTRRVPLPLVTSISQAVGLVGLGTALLIVGTDPPTGRDAGVAVLGGIAVAMAVTAFYSGLAGGTMSVVAPVSSVGISIPVVVGLLTGDDPGPIQLVGIIVAASGVIFVSRTTAESASGSQARGIALALVAAVCFGCYFIAMDAIAETDLLWVLFVTRAATVVVLLGFVLWTRPPLSAARGAAPGLIGIAVFDLAGSAAFIVAASEGLLSLVSVLGSLYAVVTILLARYFLKERINHWQRIGVVFAMTGVAMIALGA